MKVRTVRSLRTSSKQGVESHIKYRSVKNKQWDEYLQNRNREKLLYRELFMQHQKWTYLLSEIVHKKILLIFVFYFHSKLKYFWNEMAKINRVTGKRFFGPLIPESICYVPRYENLLSAEPWLLDHKSATSSVINYFYSKNGLFATDRCLFKIRIWCRFNFRDLLTA